MTKKEKIFSSSVLIIALLLTIINYIELPGNMVFHLGPYENAAYVVSKTYMLIIPLIITISGLFIFIKSKQEDLISIPLIGLMIAVILLLFNL